MSPIFTCMSLPRKMLRLLMSLQDTADLAVWQMSRQATARSCSEVVQLLQHAACFWCHAGLPLDLYSLS